jgi:signal transduction histidine kinase
MGDRTLEARLTSRLLLVSGAVLVMVGVAAVLVTDRVLDASDTSAARTFAQGSRDALRRELDEGDGWPEALDEVLAGVANGEGTRLTVRSAGQPPRAAGPVLPAMARDACGTSIDDVGLPWRVCEASYGSTSLVAAIPIQRHRRAVSALEKGMLGVLLVALLALWVSVRRAVRAPVAELAALVGWTARIVDAGEPHPPPPSTTREVAQLASAFDALVRRLLDVLARERASSAHIAHELRTPLTALTADLDMLAVTNPASSDTVRRMGTDVARLADVIDAILVLSSSSIARSDTVVNVADLARELTPGGARVDAPDEALVEADEPLVALALRNLIDNAERHANGVKAVEVSRVGTDLRLAVVDDGPGIDEASRAHMFDRYWRGSADVDGQGLGLALVRVVAERHGGSARAEPGPSGKGLCVTMTLGHVVGWHEHEGGPG